MRAGTFPDGTRTLRAKIDMASGNINLRDPALYRIKHVEHQNTGNTWPIYPMYDFAHALSDAIEGITHSLCTLEFEDHRPCTTGVSTMSTYQTTHTYSNRYWTKASLKSPANLGKSSFRA